MQWFVLDSRQLLSAGQLEQQITGQWMDGNKKIVIEYREKWRGVGGMSEERERISKGERKECSELVC